MNADIIDIGKKLVYDDLHIVNHLHDVKHLHCVNLEVQL